MNAISSKDTIRQMVADGRTTREIADAIGLGYTYVSHLRGQMGITGKRGFRPRNTERDAAILLFLADHTVNQAAAEFGITFQRVQQIAKSAGIILKELENRSSIHPRSTARRMRLEAEERAREHARSRRSEWISSIIKMRESGLSLAIIAGRVGLTQNGVSRIILKHRPDLRARAFSPRRKVSA